MKTILYILESRSTAELKRWLPSLLRGLVVLVFTTALFVIPNLINPEGMSPQAWQFTFYLVSFIGTAILAGVVSQEYIGCRSHAMTSLVAITGISSEKWTLTCAGAMWKTFLLMWLIRFPFLAWVHTQGELSWSTIFCLEFVCLATFAMLSSYAINRASGKTEQGASFGVVVSAIFLWETLSHANYVLTTIASLSGVQIPATVNTIASQLNYLSVTQRVITLLNGGAVEKYVLIQVVTMAAVSVYYLWRFSQTVFSEIGETIHVPVGEVEVVAPAGKKKKMPRCWDNALAWQAYYYHHNGRITTLGRTLGYILAIIIVLGANYLGYSIEDLMSFEFCGMLFLYANLFTANTSLLAESKEQTLPSLTLACGDPIKMFSGWQQSIWKWAIVDFYLLPVLLLSISWQSLSGAYYFGAAIIGVACLSPLLFLMNFFQDWSGRVFAVTLTILAGFALITGLGLFVGWLVSWLLVPIVVVPLLYALGQWSLHTYLPEFFDPFFIKKK